MINDSSSSGCCLGDKGEILAPVDTPESVLETLAGCKFPSDKEVLETAAFSAVVAAVVAVAAVGNDRSGIPSFAKDCRCCWGGD